MPNASRVITQLDSLPDCCFLAVLDITHPALAQSVVCSKTHRVTWIGEEQGWHSTAQPHRKYSHHVDLTSETNAGPHSSNDVVRICGTSYRKLDYWIREGWVESVQVMTDKGWSRRFTDKAIHRVKELERASKVKALPLNKLAERLRPLFDMERKARGIKDVPTQTELL